MLSEQEEACLMIIASVCAQDGLISDAEEKTILTELQKRFPLLDSASFEFYIDKFFDSNNVIEDYLHQVVDVGLQSFTIELSEKSASVDGLDFRENIALQKVKQFWSA